MADYRKLRQQGFPKRSKYSVLAETLKPVDSNIGYAKGGGLLSGLTSGLQAYSAMRGSREDEEAMDKYREDIRQKETESARLAAEKEAYERDLEERKLSQQRDIATIRARGEAGQGTGALAGSGPQLGSEFDKTFQRETAKNLAEQRLEVEKAATLVDRVAKDKEAIGSFLKENPDLIGPYSGTKSFAGKYLPLGQAFGGFDEEEQGKRGGLIRRINNVGTSLVGIATASGQSGINVQAEIDRITKGINEGATEAEITSALDELEKQVKTDYEASKAATQATVEKAGRFKTTGQFEKPQQPITGNNYSKYGLD